MSDSNKIVYCKIPLSIVEKYGDEIPFDIYLQLGDNKIIKVARREGGIKEIVKKYTDKGIDSIYTNKDDFELFIKSLQVSLTNRFFDAGSTVEDKVETLNDGYEMVRESLEKLGLTYDVANIIQEITKRSYTLINEYPNVFSYFRKFKSTCNKAFMKNTLISFTLGAMLKKATWSSKAIQEKMNLAVMLRDITLTEEQIDFIEENRGKPLPPDLKEHPNKIGDMIDSPLNTSIPKEVAVIIRQHHEQPDGSGFPSGTPYSKLTILAAYHIVADEFITLMIKYDFDLKMKADVFTELTSRYYQGDFKKAVKALDAMFEG